MERKTNEQMAMKQAREKAEKATADNLWTDAKHKNGQEKSAEESKNDACSRSINKSSRRKTTLGTAARRKSAEELLMQRSVEIACRKGRDHQQQKCPLRFLMNSNQELVAAAEASALQTPHSNCPLQPRHLQLNTSLQP